MGGISMKKSFGKFALLSCAVLAACMAFAAIYKNLALSLLETPPSSLHVLAVFFIAVIFAAAVILRFFVPMLLGDSTEESEKNSLADRLLCWASWLFLSLCLSALVAAPLADTTYYIGYGVVFAVLSSLCITLPCISFGERAAMNIAAEDDKLSTAALRSAAVIAPLLALIPSVGISSALSSMAFSTAMLREEKAPSKTCTGALIAGIISALICTALTLCFVLLLFVK